MRGASNVTLRRGHASRIGGVGSATWWAPPGPTQRGMLLSRTVTRSSIPSQTSADAGGPCLARGDDAEDLPAALRVYALDACLYVGHEIFVGRREIEAQVASIPLVGLLGEGVEVVGEDTTVMVRWSGFRGGQPGGRPGSASGMTRSSSSGSDQSGMESG